MNKLSVCFLLPSPGNNPIGGYKVVYEYANRLVEDGFWVFVVYSASIFWSKKSLFHKITNIYRYFEYCIKGYSCRTWFNLDNRVVEKFSWSLNYRHVPHCDRYIATSPYTAFYLNDYTCSSDSKYYLIQGYEDWGPGLRAILHETYHYDMHKIVISRWLQKFLLDTEQEQSTLIYNGFNFDYFRMYVPVENKDKYVVTMLYHSMECKGVEYGLRALAKVKEKYPNLTVNIFGTAPRPDDLPDWYIYYQRPDKDTHNRIYNEAGIFLGTSTSEGWGLTIGEAMICGQAIVCTDNLGYREMAIDGETALVSPIKDAQGLANSIIKLIEDDALRIRIAKNGNQFIQKFTWNESYQKFKQLLLN